MVLPTPFSSFNVGSITVIFVLDHSNRKKVYKIRLKRFYQKNKKRG